MSKFKPGLGRGLDALIKTSIEDKYDEHEIVKSSEQISSDDGNQLLYLLKFDFNILPIHISTRNFFGSLR
jgi:hypothetical protein